MPFPTTMKPETIARRGRERAKAKAEQRACLIARLRAKAQAEGGIWQELLDQQLAADKVSV
jgi:hypothetical protein